MEAVATPLFVCNFKRKKEKVHNKIDEHKWTAKYLI